MTHQPTSFQQRHLSRREMLTKSGGGAGLLALAALLADEGLLTNSAHGEDSAAKYLLLRRLGRSLISLTI